MWDFALENIDEMLVKYKKKLKNVKIYIELRRKHSKSIKNAILI